MRKAPQMCTVSSQSCFRSDIQGLYSPVDGQRRGALDDTQLLEDQLDWARAFLRMGNLIDDSLPRYGVPGEGDRCERNEQKVGGVDQNPFIFLVSGRVRTAPPFGVRARGLSSKSDSLPCSMLTPSGRSPRTTRSAAPRRRSRTPRARHRRRRRHPHKKRRRKPPTTRRPHSRH